MTPMQLILKKLKILLNLVPKLLKTYPRKNVAHRVAEVIFVDKHWRSGGIILNNGLRSKAFLR